jgi:Predicted rRNA methylase (SpoU class)
MLNIVLVEPEIPQNTGNIARTCAAIGAKLHIVKPIPFEISDRTVKRAGLDYWQYVNITFHENLDAFLETHKENLYFFSTKAAELYTDCIYSEDTFLMFGKETAGLPESLIFSGTGTAVTIPMLDHIRSLNLSNSVAVAAYEVIRQRGNKL